MDQIKLYNILRADLKLTDDKAADFISAMDGVTGNQHNTRIQLLATKEDIRELSLATKNDMQALNNKIYLIGLGQFIAIIASILAIIKFMK